MATSAAGNGRVGITIDMMDPVPRELLTHTATFECVREIGETDDGFGGTQPETETLTVTARGRYEPDGSQLRRGFAGDVEHDDPSFAMPAREVAEFDEIDGAGVYGESLYGEGVYGGGQTFETDAPVVIRVDDVVTFESLPGTYEVASIERYGLGGAVPDLVIVDPIRVDE